MTIPRNELAGLVLVGGKSTRMGQNKAMLSVAGRPLWVIARSILEPLVDHVIFIDSDAPSRLPNSCGVIRDNPPGLGPLGGLVTGLEQSGYAHHLLLAVDYPLVQEPLLRLMLERTDNAQAVCGRSPSFLEPLVAYYNVGCAPVIRDMIAEGEIRTHKLYERVPSVILDESEYDRADPKRLSQMNVNTPQDLQRVTAIFEEQAGQTREARGK